MFNRENDFRYLGDEFGYTQGMGMSYQVDFNTFNELIQKIKSNASQSTNNSDKLNLPIQLILFKKKIENVVVILKLNFWNHEPFTNIYSLNLAHYEQSIQRIAVLTSGGDAPG